MAPSPENPPPPSSGVVSLRDIAEAVGVSRMTVSRALKPGTAVRPQLREKILQTAKKMGYVQDMMVSELMTSFAHRRPVHYQETFAALWWPERWRNLRIEADFDAEVYRGLKEGAQLHGRSIDHIVLTPEMKPHVLSRVLQTRNIQGVILTPPLPANTPAPELEWDRLSVVSIGSSLSEPVLNRTQVNHYQGIVLALKVLAQRGYRRPCLLVRVDLEERMQRVYSAAFLAWGHPAERIWRQSAPNVEAMHAWLHQRAPDVIIADSDGWRNDLPLAALGCGFISLDVRDRQGEIGGVYQNSFRMAMSAVDLLIRLRLTHETGIPPAPLVMLTSGIWHEGESLPTQSAADSVKHSQA